MMIWAKLQMLILCVQNTNSSLQQMGNNLKEGEADNQLFKEYKQLRRQPRGLVLTSLEGQQTFLLKQYSFCSEIAFKNRLNQLKEEANKGPRQYIISPLRIEPRIYSSFCSTMYRIYALYQYPQVTLKEEIQARQRENKQFQQPELWSILQSCTNALAELRPIVSLNPNQIFINPDGHLKIVHQDLVDENYRVCCTPGTYYAPQKMRNFTRNDSENILRKQSIFSLGMTLLEAVQLSEVLSCYDYQQCVFNQIKLQQMIEAISNRYSQEFIQVLTNILEINPNRRTSLMQVQKVLDSYWQYSDQMNGQEGTEEIQQSQNPLSERHFNQNPTEEEEKQHNPMYGNESFQFLNKKSNAQNKILPEQYKNSRLYQTGEVRLQQRKPMARKDYILPESISAYKLQQPNEMSLQTPKNMPISSKQNIYTDPRLLEMIRKDLEDINKIKKNACGKTWNNQEFYVLNI